MDGGESAPSESLYIQNLAEKLPKEELKKALYSVFTQFGRVIDVHAAKTYRLRGQAWVSFADVTCASTAKNELQGFPFFDQPMVSLRA
jgi:U2 small nuclear ribonucleoprotein B''